VLDSEAGYFSIQNYNKKVFFQIKTDESAIFNQSFLFDFFAAAVSGEGAANHQCRSGVNV